MAAGAGSAACCQLKKKRRKRHFRQPLIQRYSMILNSACTKPLSRCPITADFSVQLTALGQLRLPIDAFFDGIVVNDDDPAIRLNRLGLLAAIREKMLMVADFSKIEG